MAATTNFYAGGTLDRAGDRRGDPRFEAELLGAPDAVLIAVRGRAALVATDARGRHALSRPRLGDHPALARAMGAGALSWALLGFADGVAHLAIDLDPARPDAGADADPDAGGAAVPLDAAARALAAPGAAFEDLNRIATRIDGPSAAIAAQAHGLMHWRRTTRFCGRCGGACTPVQCGHVMACAACGASHFPRTDPAVIMLVRSGERVLLARNARYPSGRMFSTLAGFVEPGESLEEAVAREVLEECGVGVRDVAYHSSQPWPFPGSIMLGFVAEATAERIAIDGEEIVEARWFDRDEIRGCAALGFELPPRTSIARRMIDDWIEQE